MIHLVVGNRYKIQRKYCISHAQDYLQRRGIDFDTLVNIIFVGKRKIKSIAMKYKNENEALPVLTFSYRKEPEFANERLLGEIYICYPQVVLLAAEKDKSVNAMMEDIIYHGIDNLLDQ